MAADKVGLAKQELSTLDITKLNPLSPEVISRQATINIGALRSAAAGHAAQPEHGSARGTGTIGHVAHGKSTVVKSISGVQVQSARLSARHGVCAAPRAPRPRVAAAGLSPVAR